MATETVQAVSHRGRLLRTYSLLFLFIALKAFGNLALAWGTKHFPQALAANPAAYLLAMLQPFVAIGIGMQIFALLVRIALLSVADLTFVLPITAIGYVLSALSGLVFLGETVTAVRWAGTLLIFAGTALVASTPQKSAHLPGDPRTGDPR